MRNFVELCKQGAREGQQNLLRTLSHVPDDKLHWTPAPTAKSAHQIAAHTAVTVGNFAQFVTDRSIPLPDEVEAFVARNKEREDALKTRQEVIDLLEKNTQAFCAACDTLSPEDLELTLDSQQGWSMPLTHMMRLAENHANWHVGQIDYLQTCWGDLEIYIKPKSST